MPPSDSFSPLTSLTATTRMLNVVFPYAYLQWVLFKSCKLTVFCAYGTGLSLNGQSRTTSQRSVRPGWKTLAFWTSPSKWATHISTVIKETASISSSSQMLGRFPEFLMILHDWAGRKPVFKELIKYPPWDDCAKQWHVKGFASEYNYLYKHQNVLARFPVSSPFRLYSVRGSSRG